MTTVWRIVALGFMVSMAGCSGRGTRLPTKQTDEASRIITKLKVSGPSVEERPQSEVELGRALSLATTTNLRSAGRVSIGPFQSFAHGSYAEVTYDNARAFKEFDQATLGGFPELAWSGPRGRAQAWADQDKIKTIWYYLLPRTADRIRSSEQAALRTSIPSLHGEPSTQPSGTTTPGVPTTGGKQ